MHSGMATGGLGRDLMGLWVKALRVGAGENGKKESSRNEHGKALEHIVLFL